MSGESLEARVASLETWTEGHERRCEDRHAALGREIRDLKTVIEGLTKGAWGIAMALAAWGLLQVYGNLQHVRGPDPAAAAASK